MNGIGGRTIAEAKNNMSLPEFNAWCVYRQRRGSLNLGRRVEQSGGIQASLLASLAGSKSHKTIDFMPHENKPDDNSQGEITLQQAMKEWL